MFLVGGYANSMSRIDTEVKRRLWRGDANPPEGMRSPSDSVWRRVSRKDGRNICNRPKDETREGGKAGREEWVETRDHVQRGRLEPVHAMDKL